DRSLFSEPAKYTREEIAARSGVEPEVSRLLWRALGFPDVPDGAVVFSEESVDVLNTLHERIEAWFMRRSATAADANDALIAQVRALSAGFARVAEVLSDSFVDSVAAAHELGLGDEDIAKLYVENLKWDSVERLFDYVLRLQLRAAAWRKLATEDD